MAVNGWREAYLDDLADDITVGHVGPMASEYVSNGVPFLRSQNVEPLRINDLDLKFIAKPFHDRLRKSALSPGDVVIVRTGKPGACAVVPDSLPVANCSDLVIVRCGEDLDARFLSYYVNSVAAHHIGSHLVGAVQQHFNVGSARRMLLLLPPLQEQKAIAQILGTIDDKIELNRRMNETLEAMARALFKSWFLDFSVREIPKERRLGKVRDLCSAIYSGGTPSTQNSAYWGGELAWLSSGETRQKFIINTEKTITRAGVENSSTRLAPALATVIASAGQGNTRGQTSLLIFESYVNQSVVVLVANQDVSSPYHLFFDLERRYEEFRRVSDAHSSRGSLTTKLLADLDTVLPRIELIKRFDSAVSPIICRIVLGLRESLNLLALRDALLPKLTSGELRVKEAERQLEAVL